MLLTKNIKLMEFETNKQTSTKLKFGWSEKSNGCHQCWSEIWTSTFESHTAQPDQNCILSIYRDPSWVKVNGIISKNRNQEIHSHHRNKNVGWNKIKRWFQNFITIYVIVKTFELMCWREENLRQFFNISLKLNILHN